MTTPNKTKYLRVTMPDGSKWDVPAMLISRNMCKHYHDEEARNFDNYCIASLNDYEALIDWAENNMDWSDVEHHAQKVQEGEIDWDDGWVNGEKEVVER